MTEPATVDHTAQARPDGRPQYYDIAPGDRVQCAPCLKEGRDAQYKRGEGFLADPANSPAGDKGVHSICKGCLPSEAVIFDPMDGTCRDKSGDNVWKE